MNKINFLNELVKNKGLKTVMRPNESEIALREFCKYIKDNVGEIKTLVEIGSYMGESAAIFAEEFPNTNIICVDPWLGNFDDRDSCSLDNYSEVEQQFDMRAARYPNITKFKGFSTDVEINCDIVYIDGCHKYECVKEDILHWSSLAKKAISGHDYYMDEEMYRIHPHIAGVKEAVNEFLGIPQKTFFDGSWIIIK